MSFATSFDVTSFMFALKSSWKVPHVLFSYKLLSNSKVIEASETRRCETPINLSTSVVYCIQTCRIRDKRSCHNNYKL